jgi:tRNA-specific 2-thiouridylase
MCQQRCFNNCMKITQHSHLDAARGAGEERTKSYRRYAEGAQKPATKRSAKSTDRVSGSARKQVGAVRKLRVFVGLSGGVDSSVAAALLKQQGYHVIGVFMKNWTRSIAGWPCPWREDYRDAKRVAIQLGIELKVFDFQKQYKHKVVDYMIAEYRAGRTPNPDIMCNQEIKFKLFLQTALDEGADLIATGHYARTDGGKLKMAKDKNKDQSYFLYRISREALEHTLFPIGEFESKEAVRATARRLGLVTAGRPDSQGICFVGEVGIADFIREFIEVSPGPVVDQRGRIVGEHVGAILYTVGQRHGLNAGGGTPYYVTAIDPKKNVVHVTDDLSSHDLWSDKIKLTDTHWINEAPLTGRAYTVRTRHRGELLPATVSVRGHKATVRLSEPQRAITPGQSAVIYEGETAVGGGIIV